MRMAESTRTRPRLDFGALSSFIGFHLRTAQLKVYDDFMRNAPVRGLTPGQLAILIFIGENEALTQQRLCDGIGIEKSTLVVRLHRLAERGLIKRVRSTADRRENCLELTAQGTKALHSMVAFVAKHERQICARLSVAERKQLITLLDRIG
jgi:DNA-binding MarR family transcriptional regulator